MITLFEIILLIVNILALVVSMILMYIGSGFCGDAGPEECSQIGQGLILYLIFQFIVLVALVAGFYWRKNNKIIRYFFWIFAMLNLIGIAGLVLGLWTPISALYLGLIRGF